MLLARVADTLGTSYKQVRLFNRSNAISSTDTLERMGINGSNAIHALEVRKGGRQYLVQVGSKHWYIDCESDDCIADLAESLAERLGVLNSVFDITANGGPIPLDTKLANLSSDEGVKLKTTFKPTSGYDADGHRLDLATILSVNPGSISTKIDHFTDLPIHVWAAQETKLDTAKQYKANFEMKTKG